MVSLRTANSNVKEENAGNCENLQFSVENRKLCCDNFVLDQHTATIKEAKASRVFLYLVCFPGVLFRLDFSAALLFAISESDR